MTATRQFLVTVPIPRVDETPAQAAADFAETLAEIFRGPDDIAHGLAVVPLPDLGADDSDLQISFRALSELARNGTYLSSTMITTRQAAALVAELSKQHPARTSHVDHAALDAMRAIRESDKRPGHQVQKNARAQIIITDAICRCVPEVVA